MNEKVLLILKNEIKADLIDYYNQFIFKNLNKSRKLHNDGEFIIIKENVYLSEQILKVLDSNLKDIDNFFYNLKPNDEILTSQDCSYFIKERIMRKALKSYLILITNGKGFKTKYNQTKYENFGLFLEFQWYIDKNRNQLISGEFDYYSNKIFYNKDDLLNKYGLEIFRLGKFASNYSYYKIYDSTELLKILKTFSKCLSPKKCTINNDTFLLMKNLQYLNIMNQVMCSCKSVYFLKNDSFDCLKNLEVLRLGYCNFKEDDFCFNLPNLIKLEISISPYFKSTKKIFANLSKLIELKLNIYITYLEDEVVCMEDEDCSWSISTHSDNDLFCGLENLQILRIQLRNLQGNLFKNLINLKELYVMPFYQSNDHFIMIDSVSTIQNNAFKGLENLVKLDLSNCTLNILRSKVFEGLANLKELILENSSFNQIENQAFTCLINLEHLNLKKNNIDILHKDVFQDLKNLKILNLEDFQYKKVRSNPFRFFFNLNDINANLKTLNMLSIYCLDSIEKLTICSEGSFVDLIKSVRKLRFKRLSSLHLLKITSQLTIVDFDFFNEFEQLKELSLKFTCSQSFETLILNSLTNLKKLDLSNNCMSLDYHVIENLKNLESLNLSNNKELKVNFFNFKYLKHLDLSKIKSFQLNDKIFQNLSNLETLNLSNIIDQKPTLINEFTFYGLFNLKQLNLSKNQIYHLSDNTSKYLDSLIDLNLCKCQLLSINTDAFCGLSNLENLNLSENSIEEMNETHLRDLINLKTLNLYENPFIYRKDIAQFYKNLKISDLDMIIDSLDIV